MQCRTCFAELLARINVQIDHLFPILGMHFTRNVIAYELKIDYACCFIRTLKEKPVKL